MLDNTSFMWLFFIDGSTSQADGKRLSYKNTLYSIALL